MGTLTRAEMEQVIREGGSVMHGEGEGAMVGVKRIITRIEDLPTEAQLAVGNEERENAVLLANEAHISNLLAEQRQLQAARDARVKATAEAKSSEKSSEKSSDEGADDGGPESGASASEHEDGDDHDEERDGAESGETEDSPGESGGGARGRRGR